MFPKRRVTATTLVMATVFVGGAVVMWAEPAKGVTPTLLGRGTYSAFKVKSENMFFEYEAEAKPQIDMVVRYHDYAVNGSTGWHQHPGPVFITVLSGALTFYDYDDPACKGKVVKAGQGYVDTGHGHIARNESGQPARDLTVIIAPVGQPFRSELPAPGPYCTF
jgi:cupin domain